MLAHTVCVETTPNTTMDAYVMFVKEYCVARMYSQDTVNGYWWAIKSFIDSVGDIPISQVDHQIFSDWVVAMAQKGNAKATIHTNVARFRMFIEFANRKGWCELTKDEIKLPKKTRNQHIRYARTWEIDLLIKHAGSIRNQAIIAVMFSAALRASELRNLKKSDVNLTEQKIYLEHGKGDKDATLFLTDMSKSLLERYWASRTDELPWAFVAGATNNGKVGKIASSTLRYIFEHTCRLAGIEDGISPKAVRHGHATYLMKQKIPMREIQEAMRHEFISTTQIYTHVEPQDLEHDVLPALNSALQNS